MSKRTDKHTPSNLIPSDYSHVLSFAYGGAEDLPVNLTELREMRETRPFFRKPSGKGGCDVCGAHFRMGDVFVHVPTGEHIVVGWECAEKIDALVDHSAVERTLTGLREVALRELEKRRKADLTAAFVAQHDGLATALELDHNITRDLKANLQRWGSLSEKQVALALKLAREASQPEKPKAAVPVTEDRVTVTGKVVSIKTEDGPYGSVTKMLLEVETPEGAYRLWGTMPRSISPERGDSVSLVAGIERSKRDQSFGFFSRPTGARILKSEVVA